MNTKEWEERTHYMLSRALILDVLSNNIREFTERYGSKPDLAFIHPSCRPALTKEILNYIGVPEEDRYRKAVAEPFYFGPVPIFYNSAVCGDNYMILRGYNNTKELRI